MYILKPAVNPTHLTERIVNKIKRETITNPARKRLRKSFIDKLPRYANGPDQDFSIHTLVCRRDVEMAVCTFKMLNYVTGKNYRITVHDDGTLKQRDFDFLSSHLNCTIISRPHADQAAQKNYSQFEHLLAFRSSHPIALKLADVPLFCHGKMIAYIDTDILFFQNPSFFFNVLTNAEHTKNYFNRDARNAYVTEPDAINAATGARIMPFFNGGLWAISAGDLSPEKMNNWLGLDFFRQFMGNYLLEQTLTALIATNGQNGAEYLPPDYDVAIDKNPATSVCKHYVGKIRHGYELEGLQYIFSNRFS